MQNRVYFSTTIESVRISATTISMLRSNSSLEVTNLQQRHENLVATNPSLLVLI